MYLTQTHMVTVSALLYEPMEPSQYFPGVADRIAELMNSDFYAVFTSVHEVIIHCTHTVSVDKLESIMADTIESYTSPADVLTHKIYTYSRDTKQFICVSK